MYEGMYVGGIIESYIKARLKTKFKCVCIPICFLVMSPFSRDFMKTKTD